MTTEVLAGAHAEVVVSSPPVAAVTVAASAVATSVVVGVQGPPGPAGPVGPSGGLEATLLATVPLGGYRVIASDGLGNIDYATTDNPACANLLVGVSRNAAVAGDLIQIIQHGEIEDGTWNWAPQQPVFLGKNGTLVQTIPEDATFSVIVAVPLSPTRLFITVREPIVFA
jgi:hypothetical protein